MDFVDQEDLMQEINAFTNVVQVSHTKIEGLSEQLKMSKIFLNMVIHDMRNPTSSIKAGLQMVLNFLISVYSQDGWLRL